MWYVGVDVQVTSELAFWRRPKVSDELLGGYFFKG